MANKAPAVVPNTNKRMRRPRADASRVRFILPREPLTLALTAVNLSRRILKKARKSKGKVQYQEKILIMKKVSMRCEYVPFESSSKNMTIDAAFWMTKKRRDRCNGIYVERCSRRHCFERTIVDNADNMTNIKVNITVEIDFACVLYLSQKTA